jgi:acetolactate synthase-1/2/3 large subunit
MNGQELATAVSRQANLLILVVDNGSYGTIRMHQEREYPGRVSGTGLINPDFAALARSYGAWGGTVERTEEFGAVLAEALGQRGVRLIHLKTDVEQISPALTVSGLRARAAAAG